MRNKINNDAIEKLFFTNITRSSCSELIQYIHAMCSSVYIIHAYNICAWDSVNCELGNMF